MTRWPAKPLIDVATIVSTRVAPFVGTRHYVATGGLDGALVVSTEEVDFESKPSRADLVAERDDVLFARMQVTNKVTLVTAETQGYIWSTGFAALRPSSQLRSRYLMHYLSSPLFQAAKDAHCTGATQKSVSNDGLRNLIIPVPTLNEQDEIVELLDKANDLRSLRATADARIAAFTPALFDEMFGDPGVNPQRWQEIVLGDIIHAAKDGPHVSPKYAESGVPFLSTRHVRKGQIIWEDLKFLTYEDAVSHWKKCKPEKGDVLYTKGGTTGIAAAITFETPIAVWVHVAVLKTDHNKVDPIWLENMLNTGFCYQQSQQFTHGITNRDLGLTRMVKIKMYLPPLDLQREFAERVQEVRHVETKQAMSRGRLDDVFGSVFHEAFHG